MAEFPTSPRLANIRLHPIKSLDPVTVQEARIGSNGGLELDRVWALSSRDGAWIKAKRTAALHLIRADFSPDLGSVTLSDVRNPVNSSGPGNTSTIASAQFSFPADHERASEWFSEYFAQRVIVRHVSEGVPDDVLATGPTIISTASLQAVCDLFPPMPLSEARERFRTTLEIDGVPAFWEDQLFGANEYYPVRFKIGDVAFEGSNPCERCPVPVRYPRTGEDIVGFQNQFIEMRRNSLPAWSPVERFDHFYRLATNTRVACSQQGKFLGFGDALVL